MSRFALVSRLPLHTQCITLPRSSSSSVRTRASCTSRVGSDHVIASTICPSSSRRPCVSAYSRIRRRHSATIRLHPYAEPLYGVPDIARHVQLAEREEVGLVENQIARTRRDAPLQRT